MLKVSMCRQLRRWSCDSNFQIFTRSLCSPATLPDFKSQPITPKTSRTSSLVSSVFDSLKHDFSNGDIQEIAKKIPLNSFNGLRNHIKDEIESASTVDEILSITDRSITYQESLKIISILAEWSSSKKVDLSKFQADERFIKLCSKFGSQSSKLFGKETSVQSDDLNTVMAVNGDDEAARLISKMNMTQMTKVINILATKKRRSISLLRALSFNISRHSVVMSLKTCASLLYPMVVLNFPDPVLMERICSDIQEKILHYNEKSSVIGSIVTSLGILKYKNEKLLDSLSKWMITNIEVCRPQDISAMVFTLATLNHNLSLPDSDVKKMFELDQLSLGKPSAWLDYIWSLVILDKCSEKNVASVLDKKFVETLKTDTEIPFASHKRLLNINGYAKLILKTYNGPFLSEEMCKPIQLVYAKEKKQFTTLLHDTLKSLLASDANLKKDIDSNMGFLFDALCVLDSKRNPYPVDANLNQKKNLKTVAMFALDYHDLCKNSLDPIGSICLYKRLLEAQNYKVLLVPYKDFNSSDKLIDRVQYIEKKLTEIVTENTSASSVR